MKLGEHVAEDRKESPPMFKCTQCDFTHTTKKVLGMHIEMKQRIFQHDGINYSYVDDSKGHNTVKLVLEE